MRSTNIKNKSKTKIQSNNINKENKTKDIKPKIENNKPLNKVNKENKSNENKSKNENNRQFNKNNKENKPNEYKSKNEIYNIQFNKINENKTKVEKKKQINIFNKENKNNENIQKNGNIQKKEEEKKAAEQKKKNLEQENKFRFDLLKKNYILHLIKRDGNCLFSSISDQVYGTDKHSGVIRQKCMDYIEKNKLFYSQFIEGGEAKISEYIERKRKRGIWGDNLEIQALSEIYNRPIEIYVKIEKPLKTFCNDKINTKYPIKISYFGNKHYNSIVPSTKNKDYHLFKKELLNSEKAGVYETEFIKNYDISQKLEEKVDIIKESVKPDNSFDENDFLEEDANENSKNDFNEIKKDKEDINDLKSNENKNNINENDKEYLSNPITKKALEFGFGLKLIIEALKVCGKNEELVIEYLCNRTSES